MAKVVVIKFKNGGKPYYFKGKHGDTYQRNTPVIVETAKGIEFARVSNPEHEVPDETLTQPLKVSFVSPTKRISKRTKQGKRKNRK